MPTFSFPVSPTIGQVSTQNGRKYTWSGYAWELLGNITGHASSHAANGSDPLTLTSAQISDFNSAVQSAAPSTTNASLLTSGTLNDARLSGNVVFTSDSRLSDARTPTAHKTSHATGGSDALTYSDIGAAAASHAHSALDITTGTLSDARLSNNVVFTGDSRLSDARTPTAHATTHAANGSDPLTLSAGQITGLATVATSGSYTDLTNKPSIPSPTTNASDLTSGTLADARLSGNVVFTSDSRLSNARTPTAHKTSHATGGSDALTYSDIGAAASSHTHAATDITSGTLADARLSANVVFTSDSRLSNARTPTAHATSHGALGSDALSLAATQITSGTLADARLSANVVFTNNAALTNARTPTAHKTSHATGGSDALTASDIGAAASTHTHAATDITSGTLADARLSANVVLTSDSRLSDARTPTAHKSSHATGGSDALTYSDIGAAASSHTHAATDITSGTLADARLSANVVFTNNAALTNARTPTAHKTSHATGGSDALTASDIGAAASSHTHAATDITSGTLADARLSANVVLTSDSRLSDARTPTAHATSHAAAGSDPLSLAASQITSGTLADARLSANVVLTSDSRLSDARTPTAHKTSHATGGSDALTASDIGAAAASHTHAASDITSGTVATARLGSGTANSSTYLRGDQSWATIPAEIVYTYATTADLPATGDATKLYITTDTGRQYRWVDATVKYVETGPSGSGGLSWTSSPASKTSAGIAGSIAYSADGYLYVATADATWKRVAIAGWSDDPYWSSVRGLFHFDNDFTDASTTGGTWTGSVAYSSTVKKFGTHSLYPNGSYMSRTYNSAYNFGTGDFTLECWVYPTSSSGVYGIYGTSGGSGGYPKFVLHLDNLTPKVHISNLTGLTNNWISAAATVTLNAWMHIAIVRSSGSWAWYVNGTRTATGSEAANVTFTTESTYIGYGGESYFAAFAGYIDDLRLTAVARYSGATLTVPTAAFPDAL